MLALIFPYSQDPCGHSSPLGPSFHPRPSIIYFKKLCIDLRERNINLLFQLLMHSLVDSCMCPDRDQTHKMARWEITVDLALLSHQRLGIWGRVLSALDLLILQLPGCPFPSSVFSHPNNPRPSSTAIHDHLIPKHSHTQDHHRLFYITRLPSNRYSLESRSTCYSPE